MESDILEFYFFETVERISRFIIHLEDLHKQFYSNEKSLLKDKITFISSYEECIEKLLEIVINLNTLRTKQQSKNEKKEIHIQLEHVNIAIKNLQQELLIHLPRPTEPIELRRFCRVIRKQIIQLEHLKDGISIYVNENTEDNSFASDPLENYKKEEINTLVYFTNSQFSNKTNYQKINEITLNKKKNKKDKIKSIHISIPRLDANNPCHWPTLIHEVSHNLMKKEWFNDKGIGSDFIDFLKSNNVESGIYDILGEINIESWLIECWCDLFACALIGPSFYFSQCAAFLHSLDCNKNDKYPPNHFRLKLISRFIEHRYKDLTLDEDFLNFMNESDKLLQLIDKKNNKLVFEEDNELTNLFTLFNHYFINEFFILQNGLLNFKHSELSSLFENISPFVNEFKLEKINSLVSALNMGFPIPSIREKKGENVLFEKANYVQEIFLASWLFRNGIFKSRIINLMKNISPSKDRKQEMLEIFKNTIVKEFFRFDQSILQSIQISEWVDLLMEDDSGDDTPVDYSNTTTRSKSNNSTLLIDKDIYEQLSTDKVRIIPLINIDKQLGSTSLDIRLGTSFEVFFPNQFGIVDFTDKETVRKFKNNSKIYNLDFLESIPINPGQFILGHSMEYIKLPKEICADLEGRSSFARLGIEIHMTAGFVDPGFEGVLTFEIFNAGTNPIMLYPGLRIGQLRFMKISEPKIVYSQRQAAKYRGLFGHHSSLHGEDYEIQRIYEANKKSNV